MPAQLSVDLLLKAKSRRQRKSVRCRTDAFSISCQVQPHKVQRQNRLLASALGKLNAEAVFFRRAAGGRNDAKMSNDEIVPGFDEACCDYLKVELQRVDGVDSCLALKLKGQIDAYSSRFFQRSVKRAIEAGFIHLIFILEGVDEISSSGVGIFLKLQKDAKGQGGNISIVDIHPKVREIFTLMCLGSFFSCAGSLDEAVAPMKISEKVPTFPRVLACPTRGKRLRALKAGPSRCPACKTVFSLDRSGKSPPEPVEAGGVR